MAKKEDIKLQRVYEKPIKIFGKQLKIMRVILIALICMVYTGFVFYETRSIIPLIFGSFGLGLFILAIIVMIKKIIYIKDFNLECSAAGDVYITKLRGVCPKCKGDLKIVNRFIVCSKNTSHKWDLDIHEPN